MVSSSLPVRLLLTGLNKAPSVSAACGSRTALSSRCAPTQIRIEFLDIAGDARGIRAEILLKHDAVLVDQESHNSRTAPFRRKGQQRKAACHVAPNDVVLGAPRGAGALAGEDAEIITMIGCWAMMALRVPLFARARHQRPEWALLLV